MVVDQSAEVVGVPSSGQHRMCRGGAVVQAGDVGTLARRGIVLDREVLNRGTGSIVWITSSVTRCAVWQDCSNPASPVAFHKYVLSVWTFDSRAPATPTSPLLFSTVGKMSFALLSLVYFARIYSALEEGKLITACFFDFLAETTFLNVYTRLVPW